MFTAPRALLLSAILLTAGNMCAQTLVNFDFGAVRINCGAGYSYQVGANNCPPSVPMQNFNLTPGFGWTLFQMPAIEVGGSGLTGPNTSFLPPPFDSMPFTQAVFLQGPRSFVSQSVGGFSAGSYTLSFYLGSRYASGGYDGNQTVEAVIDGNVVGTWALTSFTPFTLETAPFTVSTGGSHALEFRGRNHGDHTAFLSYVVITPESGR